MGFFEWLGAVIRLLPDIIKFVDWATVKVDGVIDWAATKQRMAQFNSAVNKAQESGDTSDVENIFNPKP